MAVCQNLVPLVNIKIAGKWMFIPLKMVLIGFDTLPYVTGKHHQVLSKSPWLQDPPSNNVREFAKANLGQIRGNTIFTFLMVLQQLEIAEIAQFYSVPVCQFRFSSLPGLPNAGRGYQSMTGKGSEKIGIQSGEMWCSQKCLIVSNCKLIVPNSHVQQWHGKCVGSSRTLNHDRHTHIYKRYTATDVWNTIIHIYIYIYIYLFICFSMSLYINTDIYIYIYHFLTQCRFRPWSCKPFWIEGNPGNDPPAVKQWILCHLTASLNKTITDVSCHSLRDSKWNQHFGVKKSYEAGIIPGNIKGQLNVIHC